MRSDSDDYSAVAALNSSLLTYSRANERTSSIPRDSDSPSRPRTLPRARADPWYNAHLTGDDESAPTNDRNSGLIIARPAHNILKTTAMNDFDPKGAPETVTLYCNSCNALVATKVLKEHTVSDIDPDDHIIDGLPDTVPDYNYVVHKFSICPKCGHPFLSSQEYLCVYREGIDHKLDDPRQVYPTRRNLETSHLPSDVKQSLVDAHDCFQQGKYKLAALSARIALEIACKTYSIESDGNLKNILTGLFETYANETMEEWGQALRLLGNAAAHHPNQKFTKNDTRVALEFLDAFLKILFLFRNLNPPSPAKKQKEPVDRQLSPGGRSNQ